MQTWAGCAVPEDRLYDVELDVWVRVEGNAARIGMTDVAQTRMGRLVQLSWKPEGRHVERGRPLSVLESAKWVGPICAPLSGTIIATNEATFKKKY
jgi:glycine cleavage system H protein